MDALKYMQDLAKLVGFFGLFLVVVWLSSLIADEPKAAFTSIIMMLLFIVWLQNQRQKELDLKLYELLEQVDEIKDSVKAAHFASSMLTENETLKKSARDYYEYAMRNRRTRGAKLADAMLDELKTEHKDY